MDADGSDEVIDLALAGTQGVDDPAARRIRKREKGINMHMNAYRVKLDCRMTAGEEIDA